MLLGSRVRECLSNGRTLKLLELFAGRKPYSVDVVVDVENESDDGPDERHVADGIRTRGHPVALHILALLPFRLELIVWFETGSLIELIETT